MAFPLPKPQSNLTTFHPHEGTLDALLLFCVGKAVSVGRPPCHASPTTLQMPNPHPKCAQLVEWQAMHVMGDASMPRWPLNVPRPSTEAHVQVQWLLPQLLPASPAA